MSTHRGVRVYGNTHGFLAGYPSTSHSISCVLLAQAGDDMQRDYWYSAARSPMQLDPAEHDRPPRRRARGRAARCAASSARARRRCCSPRNSRAASSGTWSPRCAASSQYRKSSFLLGAMGETGAAGGSCSCRSDRTCRGRSRAARSTPRAWRRATATWSPTACCSAMCSAAIRRASSGLRTTGNAGGIHNLIVTSADGRRTARGAAAPDGRRLLRHRADGAGRQRRDRRLLARRVRLLGRGRRDRLSRCTKSRSPATCGRCCAACGRSAPTSIRTARSAPGRC